MPFLINTAIANRISEDPDSVCTQTIYNRATQTARPAINTSIGAIITFVVEIEATGSDTFANKEILFTPRMYAPPNVVDLPTSNIGWRTETGTNPPLLQVAAWTGERSQRANREFAFAFQDDKNCVCVFEFHVTSDFVNWPSNPYSNPKRLLSTLNQGALFTDNGVSAFNDTTLNSELQFTIRLRDIGAPTWQYVTMKDESANEKRVFRSPIVPKWYGRNSGSTEWAWRINELRNTVGGSIVANSLFTGAPYEQYYDDNFDIISEGLSIYAPNTVEFFINGIGAPANIDDVQVFILKATNINGIQPFKDAYDYSETGFYPNGVHVVADDPFTNIEVNMSNAGGVVAVTVDGTQLTYGEEYRIGLILYDTAACNSFSILSTPLRANLLPDCNIDTTLKLGNYCGEGAGKYGLFSYHERISTSVQFDLTSFLSCMNAAGVPVSLDDLLYVSLLSGSEVTTNAEGAQYVNSFASSYSVGAFSNILDYVENGQIEIDGNVINASGVIRLSEQFDTIPDSPLIGSFLPLAWVIEFDVRTPDGQVCRLQYYAYQQIGIKEWDSDNLQIEVFNGDVWPAEARTVRSLCTVDKLVFRVTKLNQLAGQDVSLQATYYPELSPTGNTALSVISENDATAPDPAALVPQQNTLPIYDVTPFVGDVASFCIDVKDLPLNQQVYVDAIVCQSALVSCCPVITPMPVAGYWVRRSGAFVYVYALSSQFNSAITNGGGTGNTVALHNVSNPTTGDQTNILTIQQTANVHYVRINVNSSGINSVKWDLDVISDFDCDGAIHSVMHSVDLNIAFPQSNQGWIFTNTDPQFTSCTDLTV